MKKDCFLLVLDDEVNILNALKREFAGEPYGIFATADSEEALKVLKRENVKVVMSDQRMPDITGVEFLKKVKDLQPSTMRILFTGYADIHAAEEAINQGEVYRFVNKPWDSEELKRIVRDSIRRFDLSEENRNLSVLLAEKNRFLEKAKAELERMYKIQAEFTSTVSHELRTPLSAIKMAVDLILKGMVGELNEAQKKYLGMAKGNVDRLKRLIDDVLDLTKLESDIRQLAMGKADINQIVREVAESHQHVAEEKGLFLKTEFGVGLPEVVLNADKINQLLSNLISNAIKFTETGGVTVSSVFDADAKQVRICVRDTGHGISGEDLPELFQKFRQLGNAAERKAGGTGLGLAICKEIVSRHNGRIWAESETGKGSSFFVELPVS